MATRPELKVFLEELRGLKEGIYKTVLYDENNVTIVNKNLLTKKGKANLSKERSTLTYVGLDASLRAVDPVSKNITRTRSNQGPTIQVKLVWIHDTGDYQVFIKPSKDSVKKTKIAFQDNFATVWKVLFYADTLTGE